MRLFLKDADFEAFERTIEKTLQSRPMRICSYCLMPNHWHFVLWPERDGDLAAFIRALALERPLIVGHSWGGNVALQFATDHPDQVSGLVLVDGGFLEITAIEGMTWERTEEVMAPPPLDGMKLEAFQVAARSRLGRTSKARAALPTGSSRARITTANATASSAADELAVANARLDALRVLWVSS